MNSAVGPVMESLYDFGYPVPSGVIVRRLDLAEGDYPKSSTIHAAIKSLREHDFIEYDEEYESYLKLTEKGKRWVEDDLDESELSRN